MRDQVNSIEASRQMYSRLVLHERRILDYLTSIETIQTARQELAWTRCALNRADALAELIAGRDPLGQVAVYLPSNLPLYSCYQYALAPLLSGNTISLHLSSQSGEVLRYILPLLLSDGHELHISDLPRSEFTTSIAMSSDAVVVTGNRGFALALAAESPQGTIIVYQGGGVNPFIVDADAKVDLALELAARCRLFNSGQDCCASDCFYVHVSLFGDIVRGLCTLAKTVTVGPNRSDDTIVGPLMRAESTVELLRHARNDRSVVPRVPSDITGTSCNVGVYECSWDAALFNAEKFAPIFTVAAFDDYNALFEHLAEARHRMILTVVGEAMRFGSLRRRYGHFLLNTSIYDCEDAHTPFGGFGHSTFHRDKSGTVVEGPLYIPWVLTNSRR